MPKVFDQVGSGDSFNEAYEKIHPIVRHAVKRILGFDHCDVDDVIQDVMLLMVRIFDTPQYAAIGNRLGFFRNAARWKAISHLRSCERATIKLERYISDTRQPVMILNLDIETIPLLFRQLHRYNIPALMPPRRWLMFEHRYLRGLSSQEIANLMQVNDQVVRFQLSLATGEVIAAMRRITLG